MTCNNCRCGNTNSCGCSLEVQPYYVDPCLQANQGHCAPTFVCRYTPTLRIENEWAVPLFDQIITLRVPALTDILIGAVLWNPDYGTYLIVSYDENGQQIKVQKTTYNEVADGTIIPACTKFLIGSYNDSILNNLGVFSNFTPDPVGASGAGGDLDAVNILEASYSEAGEKVDVVLTFTFDIITATIGWVNIDLPKQAINVNQKIPCFLKIGSTYDHGTLTVIAGQSRAVIQKRDLSDMAIAADCEISLTFFYRKET